MKIIEEHACFNGIQRVYEHDSLTTKSKMRFGIFLPEQAKTSKLPILYWLSGLTCNEQNFINKAGAQRIAARLGLIMVTPDTSPREPVLPGDRDNYDFGIGAGFYVDAIQAPWKDHYQMYSYIQQELPELLQKFDAIDLKKSGIFGHSMGGHGALVLALKNPQQYQSVSAFAPLCAASDSSWGEKAFGHYLGSDKSLWKEYDACELILKLGWPHQSILIDQGSQDPWLSKQLKPHLFAAASEKAGVKLDLRMQNGYDHSYYFIMTFIEDHLRFHAKNFGIL